MGSPSELAYCFGEREQPLWLLATLEESLWGEKSLRSLALVLAWLLLLVVFLVSVPGFESVMVKRWLVGPGMVLVEVLKLMTVVLLALVSESV